MSSKEQFHLWTAEETVTTLEQWKKQYPNFVEVTTAQSKYGLPRAGLKSDCPYDGREPGCFNHFFTIQDFIMHPKGSASDVTLPEVLWTGSLHGDEKLGPTVVMETAALLLEAASCEALPRLYASNWDKDVEDAKNCRATLRQKGVDDTHRQWLARLVATRRIVVVPNANALGAYRGTHLEDSVDPLEDFPYNTDSTESCMRTITARTLNEIFLEHMFQMALSFMEGEDAIEYSWASQQYATPDSIAFGRVAASLSHVVGGDTMYPYGPSNTVMVKSDMVFQDWAYAASWENPRVLTCHPFSYGGYDIRKTSYPVETNRALSLTVKSRSREVATGRQLGGLNDVFHAKDNAEGHIISKNMRLALVSTDLVQPYVSIFGVNNVALSDDVVPSNHDQLGNMCDTSRTVAVPGALDTVIVEWTVGGALDISKSDLWVAKVEDLPGQSLCSLSLNDGFAVSKDFFRALSSPKTGTGFFSPSGANPSPTESMSKPFTFLAEHGSVPYTEGNAMGGTTHENGTSSVNLLGPVFRAEIDLRDYEIGDRLVLVATATVDQDWFDPPSEYHQPLANPQSHLANMRTNPDHEFEISGKRLEGRLQWLSIPVTVIVDEMDIHAGGIEMFKRLDEGDGYQKPAEHPTSTFESESDNSFLMMTVWIGIAAVSCLLIGVLVFVASVGRGRRRRSKNATMEGRDGITKSDPFRDGSSERTLHARSRGRNRFVGRDEHVEDLESSSSSENENRTPEFQGDDDDESMVDIVDFETSMIHAASSYPSRML